MVIFLDLTKNIYQNGKYIYYDGTSKVLHRYLSVLTNIEIFRSNEQNRNGIQNGIHNIEVLGNVNVFVILFCVMYQKILKFI